VVYRPSDLSPVRAILDLGGPNLGSPPVERKLLAIFAADVEGYSRLMGRDEVAREAT
jgi:class 3 adenylate cyclase